MFHFLEESMESSLWELTYSDRVPGSTQNKIRNTKYNANSDMCKNNGNNSETIWSLPLST